MWYLCIAEKSTGGDQRQNGTTRAFGAKKPLATEMSQIVFSTKIILQFLVFGNIWCYKATTWFELRKLLILMYIFEVCRVSSVLQKLKGFPMSKYVFIYYSPNICLSTCTFTCQLWHIKYIIWLWKWTNNSIFLNIITVHNIRNWQHVEFGDLLFQHSRHSNVY